MNEKLYSTNDAANYLEIKPQTVRNWVYKGFLTPLKLRGWSLRFKESDLDKLLERKKD